jgi:hypothetical protein
MSVNVNYDITQTGGANVDQAFEKINSKIVQSTAAVQTLTKRTGDYNMVGMNTARLFSDMGYAAQSFSFGVMSIGNNISPLVESIQRARSAGQSWKELLMSTFTGISGGLVAINILVSAITAYSIATAGAKRETEDWNLKTLIGDINAYANSLRGVKKELSELSDIDLGKTVGEINKKIAENLRSQLRAMQAQAIANQQSGFGGAVITAIFGKPEDYEAAIKKLNDTLKSADEEIIKRIQSPDSLNFLRTKLKGLVEEFEAGNTALAPQINTLKSQIKSIEDLINPKTGTRFNVKLEQSFALDETLKDAYKDEVKSMMDAFDDFNKFRTDAEIENYKLREDYLREYKSLQVDAIKDSYDREIASARLKADEMLTIYKDYLTKKIISDEEYANIAGIIEESYSRRVSDIENKKEKESDRNYNKLLTESRRFLSTSKSIGNNLEIVFAKAGQTFFDKMVASLEVVQSIIELMKTVDIISAFIKGATAIASGGTSLAGFTAADYASGVKIPGKIIGGGGGGMQTVNYDINIGGEKIARITAKGYQVATELRYL